MPLTKTITLYTYDELDPSAQEKARDWYRQCLSDDLYELEAVCDCVHEVLGYFGFTVDRKHMYFDCSYSQGSGASFEGTWDASEVNLAECESAARHSPRLEQALTQLRALLASEVDHARIKQTSHHYYHGNTMQTDLCLHPDNADGFEVECSQELYDDMTEFARDLARYFYNSLIAELEYQGSDEAVTDAIRLNDYTFTEDGTRAD